MSETIELTLSSGTVAQLQQIAEDQECTPEALAEQAIQHYLWQETHQKMQEEVEAFGTMEAELLPKYADQYVAIHQGQVVDHDPDQFKLYYRIEEAYPHEPVLIQKVLPEPEAVDVAQSSWFEN